MLTITADLKVIAQGLEVGDTTRVCHEGCAAGEDTRSRLYLTRPDNSPGIVLMYCHNCGDHAVYRGGQATFWDRWRPPTNFDPPKWRGIPKSIEHDPAFWPTDAEAWRLKSKLSRNTCSTFGVGYDSATHSIYLPMLRLTDPPGPVSGYQLRPLNKDTGAKYITYMKDADSEAHSYLGTLRASHVVLVEDFVSGIHIHSTGYSALVNHGTNVKPTILNQYGGHEKNTVWFDNDNPSVLRHAEDAARVWDMLHSAPTHLIKGSSDPKHYNETVIKQVIDACPPI
jgi:hypothetical protein